MSTLLDKIKIKRSLGSIGILILAFIVYIICVNFGQRTFVPPSTVVDIQSLQDWMGQPKFIQEIVVDENTYFECYRDTPIWILILTLASGPASYTFDQKGRFIGWSPDSGDVKRPSIVYSKYAERKIISLDRMKKLIDNNTEAQIHDNFHVAD